MHFGHLHPVAGAAMKATRLIHHLLAICCLAAATTQAAPPARWTFIHLGDMAGGVGGANAQAVNDRGQVVGSATARAPGGFGFALHAFLWEDGVMRDMGTPAGKTMSDAIDINDRGTALGGDGLGGQYLWRDGEWVRLSAPGIVDR